MKPLVAVILVIPLLAACGGEPAPAPTAVPPAAAANVNSGAAVPTASPTRAAGGVDTPVAKFSSGAPLELVTYAVLKSPYSTDSTLAGVVKNNAETPLIGINITAEIKDASGATLLTAEDVFLEDPFLPVVIMAAGAEAPFMILFQKEILPEHQIGFKAEAHAFSRETFSDYNPIFDLAVVGAKLGTKKAGLTTFQGMVKNNSRTPAWGATVLAWAYDAGGKLVDVDAGFLSMPILPGEEQPFGIRFVRGGGAVGTIATFKTYVVSNAQQ